MHEENNSRTTKAARIVNAPRKSGGCLASITPWKLAGMLDCGVAHQGQDVRGRACTGCDQKPLAVHPLVPTLAAGSAQFTRCCRGVVNVV